MADGQQVGKGKGGSEIMDTFKNFFRIETKYRFEVADLSAILTVLNVALILIGIHWAPLLGIGNCIISLIVNIKERLHINMYVIQISLVVLNLYFLSL